MGFGTTEAAMGPDKYFEAAVHGEAAPVRIVRCKQRRPYIVLFRLDSPGDKGIATVRTDHDPRAGEDRPTVRGAAFDTNDAAGIRQQVVDMDAFTNINAGF